MIINALVEKWKSDINLKNLVRYLNPADFTQQELQKLIKIMLKSQILKAQSFQSKLETFKKLKKKNLGISVFSYENNEKHSISVSKIVVKKNMLIYY